MDEYQAPELMRTPLDEMVLQVKLFEPTGGATGTESHKIADFLSKAPEPPRFKGSGVCSCASGAHRSP